VVIPRFADGSAVWIADRFAALLASAQLRRRLHSHEEVFPGLDSDSSDLFRDRRRERPIVSSSMPDQHHHSPGKHDQRESGAAL